MNVRFFLKALPVPGSERTISKLFIEISTDDEKQVIHRLATPDDQHRHKGAFAEFKASRAGRSKP